MAPLPGGGTPACLSLAGGLPRDEKGLRFAQAVLSGPCGPGLTKPSVHLDKQFALIASRGRAERLHPGPGLPGIHLVLRRRDSLNEEQAGLAVANGQKTTLRPLRPETRAFDEVTEP